MRTDFGGDSFRPDDFPFSFDAGPVLRCTWARHCISGGAISCHRPRVHRARRNALHPKFSRFAAATRDTSGGHFPETDRRNRRWRPVCQEKEKTFLRLFFCDRLKRTKKSKATRLEDQIEMFGLCLNECLWTESFGVVASPD